MRFRSSFEGFESTSLVLILFVLCSNRFRPNMIANPLPNHTWPNVNAVMEKSSMGIKTRVDEVKSSMDEVCKMMVRMRAILGMKVFERSCCYY